MKIRGPGAVQGISAHALRRNSAMQHARELKILSQVGTLLA